MGQKETPGWLVFGHYGGNNTGDEAMLLGLIDRYLSDGQLPMTIVYKGAIPLQLQKRGVKFIQPKAFIVLINIIRSHGIIFGGGTHFQDDYNGVRVLRHYRYMLRFIGISCLAKLFRKQVIWLSMGFGPFLRAPSRWLTSFGLKFPDFVTARDSHSMREISSWISPQKVQKGFDLAALLFRKTDLNKPRKLDENEKGTTLGISVTPAENSKSLDSSSETVFWDNLLVALQDVYRDNPQLRIKVIIIRGGQRESDVELSNRLYRHLYQTDPQRVDLVPYQADPCDTLKEIQSCSAFIATRFHSAVLAYLSQCNLLILAYHRKLLDFANEIGLQAHACIPIDGTYPKGALEERIVDLLTRPERYKASLPVQKAVEIAYVNISALKRFESS